MSYVETRAQRRNPAVSIFLTNNSRADLGTLPRYGVSRYIVCLIGVSGIALDKEQNSQSGAIVLCRNQWLFSTSEAAVLV